MNCAHCRSPATLLCSKCVSVVYCKRECQLAHRPAHRSRCIEPKEVVQRFIEDIAQPLSSFSLRHQTDSLLVEVPASYRNFAAKDRSHLIDICRGDLLQASTGSLLVRVRFFTPEEGQMMFVQETKKIEGVNPAPETESWTLLYDF
jgi:hypothetical protein